MSKSIDLTDKLGLGEQPTIKLGNAEVSVNNSAKSVLQLMTLVGGDEVTPQNVLDAYELLFDAKDRKTLDKLNLSFVDLHLLIETAMQLIVGEATGETETLATT